MKRNAVWKCSRICLFKRKKKYRFIKAGKLSAIKKENLCKHIKIKLNSL